MSKVRYGILIICFILLIISGCKDVAAIIDGFGYKYDEKQDIYVSKIDSWQRRMGYSSLIDLSAAPTGMIIDCEPIKFDYNGQPYMIELWKGQYDLSTGSEIGIYKKSNSNAITWDCGDDNDILEMSYSLKKKGNEIFNRNGKHWWLTGFAPGKFSNPEDLTMDITINFDSHPGMLNPFIKGLKQSGYNINQFTVNGNKIKFVFKKPKTPQPVTNKALIADTQKKNKLLVDMYNKAKKDTNVTDNSPRSIDKMLIKMPDLIEHLIYYKINK